MTTGVPEIKVRLTPEGLGEVAAALREVQRQAQAAADTAKAAQGIDLITGAIGKLRGVLGALGIATSIAGIVALGKNAIDSAEDIGKFSRLAGASVEDISALAFAAKLAGVEQDTLRTALVNTAKSVGELNRGVGAQVDVFDRLGFTAKDFAGKDTAQAIDLISSRLAKLPDGWQKTEIARAIFGRGLAELSPLLDKLSTKGLAGIREEAQAAGAVIGGESVEQAKKFNESLRSLEASSASLVRQFVGELLPSLNNIAEVMLKAKSGGSGFVSTLFQGAVQTLKELPAELFAAVPALALYLKALQAVDKAEKERAAAEKAAVESGPPAPKSKAGAAPGLEDPAAFAAAQERLNAVISRAGLEQIAIVKEIAKQRQDAAEKGIAADLAETQARLASTAHLLSSQQALEKAELDAIARRSDVAKSAYAVDIRLADARANVLRAAAVRQYSDAKDRANVITLIDRQANEQRLAAGKTRLDALTAAEIAYANQAKTAATQILALDKQLAASRKSTSELIRGIDEAGFTDQQKIASLQQRLIENEDNLRSAVLHGDSEKQKEFFEKGQALAKEIADLGQTALAKQFLEGNQSLREEGLRMQTQAQRDAAAAAQEGIAKTKQDLIDLKSQLDGLEVKVVPDKASLTALVDQIHAAFDKEEFSIKVTPLLQPFGSPDTAASRGAVANAVPFTGASGGVVPGVSPTPRSDNIRALLTAGEYVLRVPAVNHYGTDFLDRVNAMKFADGGPVGGVSKSGAGGPVHRVDISIGGGRPGRFTGSRRDIEALNAGLRVLQQALAGDGD